jgi:hypothetical protein
MARPVVMGTWGLILGLVGQGRLAAQSTAPAQPAVLWERTKDADEAKRAQKSADDKSAPKANPDAPARQEAPRWERSKDYTPPPQTARAKGKQK